MVKATTFWDRIAERYAKQPVPDEAVYQKKLELTRAYFSPEAEVLEFGCGTGSTAIAHAPFAKHIRAIDFSEKMIEIARDKADAAGITNVSFEQAAIENLASAGNTYDAVLGHSILHLLENRDEVIARVYEVLKPGGVFVSSTACLGMRYWYLKLVLPLGRLLGFLPLVRFFSADDLATELTDAGFEIEHQWLPDKSMAVFIIAKKPT